MFDVYNIEKICIDKSRENDESKCVHIIDIKLLNCRKAIEWVYWGLIEDSGKERERNLWFSSFSFFLISFVDFIYSIRPIMRCNIRNKDLSIYSAEFYQIIRFLWYNRQCYYPIFKSIMSLWCVRYKWLLVIEFTHVFLWYHKRAKDKQR